MRRAPEYGLAAALTLSSALTSQAQLIEGQGTSPDGLASELGTCPQEALSAAYAEMGALEGDAIVKEVLRLCTDRAEAITGFLNAQAELGRALMEVTAVRPAPVAGPVAPAPPPASPPADTASEDTPGFSAMREDLEALRDLAGAPDRTITGPAETVGEVQPGQDATVAETVWVVVWTAASGEGAWLAALRSGPGLRETEAAPRLAFELQEPQLVRIGDALPDGREIVRINAGGVWVDPVDGSQAAEPLPWAESGDVSTAGVMEWVVIPGATP